MLSHTITGIGDGDAFDNNTALNASLVTDDQRAGLYIFGQNRHRWHTTMMETDILKYRKYMARQSVSVPS